ncbi:MAG: hypothetical protein P8X82_04935 [Gemmatimonadales bacterium]
MKPFLLIPISASMLEVREHLKCVDEDAMPDPEEMRYMTDLIYRLVPTMQALERYAEQLAGKPVLN